MHRTSRALAALAVAALATLTVAQPASATNEPIPVESDCLTGWYVNHDEGDLLPEQVEAGLLFDGPSLVHYPTSYTIATMPTDGAFVADVQQGVAPLFKVETAPYSTINKTAAGKYWSSKIPAGDPGGQSNPVDTPQDLIGKWNYTAETAVFSFGVGYANDAGGRAVVSSITWSNATYDLTCKPAAEPTPVPAATTTAQPTVTATEAPTASPTVDPTATPSLPTMLPVTGGSVVPKLIVLGAVLVALGVLAVAAVRSSRWD